MDSKLQISAVVSGGKLTFSTDFGLTIVWDGNNRADVYLCDEYKTHVCGLCGNADGKSNINVYLIHFI